MSKRGRIATDDIKEEICWVVVKLAVKTYKTSLVH